VLRAKTPRLFLSHPRLYQPDEKTAEDDDDDEDENDSEMTLNTYFVPGYDQPVPPGQKPFADRSASQLS
jgi:hypothetical protein